MKDQSIDQILQKKEAFLETSFSLWNKLYIKSLDTLFIIISIIFVLASIYEFTMRYLIQYYTFWRLAFLFLGVSILYIIKKTWEQDQKIERFLRWLQFYSSSLFYGAFIVFVVFLILSVNFYITQEFLRFLFGILLVSYAVFKYYGHEIQFQKISLQAFSADTVKLYVLFFCISIFTLTPFVNATYLYNNRVVFFPILMVIDTILVTYLLYEFQFLNQFIPRKFRKQS